MLLLSAVPIGAALAGTGPQPAYNPAADLVARRTSTPPTIDGVAEAAWDDALVLNVLVIGNSGSFDLKLKAMFDDDFVYILANWSEPSDQHEVDKDREAWELTSNATPGTWERKDLGTDRLSIAFEDPDRPVANFSSIGCDAICHNLDDMFTVNPGEELDMWVWSISNTDLQGYADDAVLRNNNSLTIDPKRMHLTKSDLHWDAGADGWWINNNTSSPSLRPTYIWDPAATPSDPSYMWLADALEVDWDTFDITSLATGSMVPSYVLMTPSGDRADVQAKGTHDGANWTVEFKRLRDTGSDDDTIFDSTNVPYYFSPSMTDNKTGADHSKAANVYKLWLAEPEMPDLVVARANPSGTSFIVNDTVSMGVWVENIGWSDAGPSKLSYYWDTGGSPTPQMANTRAVPWGASQFVSFDVSTSGLAPGNNTLVLTADADLEVVEINEANNEMRYVIELDPEPLPDLLVESIELDPEPLTQGAYTDVTVSILNDGTNHSGASKVRLYLDDPGDPIATDPLPVITKGARYNYQFRWGPIALGEGDYMLNVTLDPDDEVRESDETNNDLGKAFTVESPTLPDLVIDSLTPLSTTVVQDADTSARIIVSNDGGAPLTDDFEVALFLDQAFTVGTTGLMGKKVVTDDLAVGGNVTVIIQWKVPIDTDPGPHFLRAEVDWLKAVEELEEGNNNATFDELLVERKPLPDLVVVNVLPASPQVRKDELLVLMITVKNQGNDTSLNTTLNVTDATHDKNLEVLQIPELEPNATVDLEFRWIANVAEDDIALQFIADPFDYIEEENEFNNALNAWLKVLPPLLPDLYIPEDGVTFTPAEPRLGEAVTISVRVANDGTNASKATKLRIRLGNDEIALVGVPAVDVGASRTVDVVWPANEIVTAMTFNLNLTVDPDGTLKEMEKSNNDRTVSITFFRPPTAALDNLALQVSKDVVKVGQSLTLTISLENGGDAPALVTIVVKDGLDEVASRQGIAVAAGGEASEAFELNLKGTGDHVLEVTIFVGGEVAKDTSGLDLVKTVTVQVKEEGDDGSSSWLYAVVAAVVIVVVLLALVLFLRRK